MVLYERYFKIVSPLSEHLRKKIENILVCNAEYDENYSINVPHFAWKKSN